MAINWRTTLRRKRSTKGVKTLGRRAGTWCDCAVGERRFELRNVGVKFDESIFDADRPTPPYIRRLGYRFYRLIEEGDKAGALEVLDKLDRYIELRS